MKCAVDLLSDPKTPYEKIIIVRPAVEAEEKLGSLPGGVEEKLDPYIFPSYYLLNKIIGKDLKEKLKEEAMGIMKKFMGGKKGKPGKMMDAFFEISRFLRRSRLNLAKPSISFLKIIGSKTTPFPMIFCTSWRKIPDGI